MFVVLGIILGVLLLVSLFLIAGEVALSSRITIIKARQGRLERELNIAKDQYKADMLKNNKEIAKELYRYEKASTFFVGYVGTETNRVPVSEVLARFMGQLGYCVIGREFKIIKKGDQGDGKASKREETVKSGAKKEKS